MEHLKKRISLRPITKLDRCISPKKTASNEAVTTKMLMREIISTAKWRWLCFRQDLSRLI